MHYRYYLIALMWTFLSKSADGMFLIKSTKTPMRTTQSRYAHRTRPIDDDFIDSIDNLSSLEYILKKDYHAAKNALLDLYPEEKEAFLSFEKTNINYINNYALKETHCDVEHTLEDHPKVQSCFEEGCHSLGMNPKAISFTQDNDIEGLLGARAPWIQYQTKTVGITLKNQTLYLKERVIDNPIHYIPAHIKVSTRYLNFLETIDSINKNVCNLILQWHILHELSHIKQLHGLLPNLLGNIHNASSKGSEWDMTFSSERDLTNRKEYTNFIIEIERQADLLPLMIDQRLSRNMAHLVKQTTLFTKNRKSLYLTHEEFLLLSDRISKCWRQEPSDTRPMPIMYE